MDKGDVRIYAAKEMKAIDMAEAMRAAIIEEGILQGCRLSYEGNTVYMTPGRVLIGGRLGVFEAEENQNRIALTMPNITGAASNLKRYVCIVYDPTQEFDVDDVTGLPGKGKIYVEFLTSGQIRNMEIDSSSPFYPGTTENPRLPYDFNVNNYGRIMQLAYVEISYQTGAVVSLDTTAKTDDNHVNQYPIVYNKRYVDNEIDRFKTRENNRYSLLNARDTYHRNVRHRSDWFKNDTVTIDGVKVGAGKAVTLRVRKEIGGQVFIQPESGSAPSFPTNKPYTYLKKDDYSVLQSSAGPSPLTTKTEVVILDEHVITNTNTVDLNRGIVGVKISNASSGGTGGTNCVVQSFWVEPSEKAGNVPAGKNWRGFMDVVVRNVGSSAAKIKVEITSLYVRNSDFDY